MRVLNILRNEKFSNFIRIWLNQDDDDDDDDRLDLQLARGENIRTNLVDSSRKVSSRKTEWDKKG
jgi:hypothetical protein